MISFTMFLISRSSRRVCRRPTYNCLIVKKDYRVFFSWYIEDDRNQLTQRHQTFEAVEALRGCKTSRRVVVCFSFRRSAAAEAAAGASRGPLIISAGKFTAVLATRYCANSGIVRVPFTITRLEYFSFLLM